ncbi:MAG: choice-of-anchor J domain-containing protein [Tenuifilaceae bacterium]|nr:choice-of-anchor J domain-containing protein [Tenuifilaceae bacterium]
MEMDGNKWGIYQNSSEVEIAYSGTKCAGVKYNTSGNNDWLITPLLTLPAGEEIEFSFWAKSQDPAYLESFDIQISTDEGVSFTKIGYETDISASYTKYSYDLSGYAGQNVHIAIVCVSVNKFFLYVDDISCATKESTYSPIIPLEFNIIAYPNPFTNNLTIESDKGIRRIVITNINGQVVIQKHINGEISKQINTQKLGSGLYLLQVIDINRKSTHIKLVKP